MCANLDKLYKKKINKNKIICNKNKTKKSLKKKK